LFVAEEKLNIKLTAKKKILFLKVSIFFFLSANLLLIEVIA